MIFLAHRHPLNLVVALMHAAQGVLLLIILFTFKTSPIPPISLTMGRVVALLAFVFIDKNWLTRRSRRMLTYSTGLMLLKISLRALGFMPEMGTPLEPLLDAVLLIYMSVALYHLGTMIKLEENAWAQMIFDAGHADFDDFNNPEHSWNKEEKAKELALKRANKK